ncbi:isotrichodermin C-15 hydroxylase [Biscogniauxia marginata]|nr:isotrichodermin C-15 hydroxylase [Biscogniauxia marginata]
MLSSPLIPLSNPWTTVPLIVVTATILYVCLRTVYNVFFHPLRKFPGPLSRAASRLPFTVSMFRGDPTRSVKLLHDKYGPVVRTAPDQLSFITTQAWLDIYGPKQSEMRGNMLKDILFYGKSRKAAASLPTANDADHRRLRRLQAPAFSEKAVSLQEEYLQQYTAMFISRLRDLSSPPHDGAVDVVHWLNLLTTDIIGELAFGENFGGLQKGEVHPWLGTVFGPIKMGTLMRETRRLSPWLAKLIRPILLVGLLRGSRQDLLNFASEAVQRRMGMGIDRPDLMSYILMHRGQGVISDEEIGEAAPVFIAAGSETTATFLAGSLYLLCRNPHILQKIREELCSEFRSASELTILRLQHQEYLHAVIQESFRLYPPVPDGLFRRTTAAGAIVAGEVIPPGTNLMVNLWAANRSERNFHRPEEFIPERWLKSCPPEFSGDDRAVLKPFSTGPRDCIGKTLALAEIRVVLANILWHFDLELLPESEGWMEEQKIFFLWEKPSLKLKLIPRN